MTAPRFKGKPDFDLSQLCSLCGYRVQPSELMRLASHIIKCPKCGDVWASTLNGGLSGDADSSPKRIVTDKPYGDCRLRTANGT